MDGLGRVIILDTLSLSPSPRVLISYFFFFFFMNGNTERAQCALSRVCIP